MAAQDMPPPGGFSSINIQRTLAKPFLGPGIWFGILLGMTINGLYVLRDWRKRHTVLKIEQMDHYLAAHPFLCANQERKFLLHLHGLREEERELMKDHPGWVVGTLYGERVFKTLPEGSLPPIVSSEYIAHRSRDEWLDRVVLPDKHQ